MRLASRAAIAHSIIGGSPCALDEGRQTLASSIIGGTCLACTLRQPCLFFAQPCCLCYSSHGLSRVLDLSTAGCHVPTYLPCVTLPYHNLARDYINGGPPLPRPRQYVVYRCYGSRQYVAHPCCSLLRTASICCPSLLHVPLWRPAVETASARLC